MQTTKHTSNKYMFTPRASDTKAMGLTGSLKMSAAGILTTEDQQYRIKKIIDDVRKGKQLDPQATIVAKSELIRMKNAAAILTKEEILQQKKIHEEQTEMQQAAAKARKQKMMEIEAERRKNIPPSEIELEKKMKADSLKDRAKALLDEERDDVKHMNQMMLYAKVVTIRDKQLDEKKAIQSHFKNEEKRKDLLMEIERLKKIKYYEEQDKRLKEENQKSVMQTFQQMQERQLVRLKEQEEKEREGREMVQYIKQVQLEDSKNTLERKEQQRIILDQILKSNQAATRCKQDRVIVEKEEEERIARYNVEKAQKELEYQAELKRIQDEKEREVCRLRELQEKASDRQAEIDAIRAKRATEQADRLAREKDRRDAEARLKINQELLEARYHQNLEKEKRIQEQAKLERDEFQRIVQNQKIERDRELRTEEEKRARFMEHSEQLKKQIALNEERRKQNAREYLEEGKKMKDKIQNEKYLLEDIKARKLNELQSLDIPTKYATELARKRIVI